MSGPLVNRRLLAEEAREDKQAHLQYKEDLLWLLKAPVGRRFLYGLIFSVCGVEDQSYQLDGSTNDAIFREGARSVGLKLIKDLQLAHPSLYCRTLSEQINANMKQLKDREAARSQAATSQEDDEND